MSSSLQQNNDLSQWGFEPVESVESVESADPAKPVEEVKQEDYSEWGFQTEQRQDKPVEQKPKEKVGKLGSIGYGALEGIMGIPSLVEQGFNAWSKPLEDLAYGEGSGKDITPISDTIQSFPESEDQSSRRLRVGTAGAVTGSIAGIPGIIAGIVGSQAGQTVREVWGKDGKFDGFGWGEGSAIATDLVFGGAAGIGASLAKRGIGQASRTPALFQEASSPVRRQFVKNAVRQEKNALNDIISGFSAQQTAEFEQNAARVSPLRYTELAESNASQIKINGQMRFRNSQLDMISPLEVTPVQGGNAIQQAANTVFQETVIQGERQAYTAATQAAEGLSGTAPRTLEQARTLRADLARTTPTSEQNAVISYLDNLILTLETETTGSIVPASTILDVHGNPVSPRYETGPTTNPTQLSANDMVKLVQDGNNAVNYGSELRLQSHRLKPILDTMRQETRSVLSQNEAAVNLYDNANRLHASNAETWGTKYMRDVRFSENPENIIGRTKKSSNMANLNEAIQDPTIKGIAERLVVEDITKSGSVEANRRIIRNMSGEMSPQAQAAADNLINVKDPLTSVGGREAVRNTILKDAAQSVSTGKSPDKILDLMQTQKGYNLVAESMNSTPESRQLFQSFERLFVEDLFSSVSDKTGVIDFKKANVIMKNSEIRSVVRRIGGDEMFNRLSRLENLSERFQSNMEVFKNPETATVFRQAANKVRNVGFMGAILNSIGVPRLVLAGLGVGNLASSAVKGSSSVIFNKVLSNPRAIDALEAFSRSANPREVAKNLPRLISELEKLEENKPNNNKKK